MLEICSFESFGDLVLAYTFRVRVTISWIWAPVESKPIAGWTFPNPSPWFLKKVFKIHDWADHGCGVQK